MKWCELKNIQCLRGMIFLLCVSVCLANTCHKTAIIQRSVSQNGFHRVLQSQVTVPWNLTGCRLLLEEKLPRGVFVDPDELQARGRGSQPGAVACVLAAVDVEAFEPASLPLRVYVYTPPLLQGQTELILELPMHVRYHRPSPGGVSASASLPQPSLLVSCPPQAAPPSCPGWSEGPAPCPLCSRDICDWTHLPYSSAQLELKLDVPVGNSDHGAAVTAITALTLVVATLFLLWTLQASAKKNR